MSVFLGLRIVSEFEEPPPPPEELSNSNSEPPPDDAPPPDGPPPNYDDSMSAPPFMDDAPLMGDPPPDDAPPSFADNVLGTGKKKPKGAYKKKDKQPVQVRDLIGRVPPQDLEAERAVLGSILLSNEAFYSAVENLNEEDFYRPAHAMIFRSMVELSTVQEPIDAITLSSRLRAKNELEKAGGLPEIVALASVVATASNIAHYAEIVRKKSMLRRLINTATEIAASAYEAPNPDETVDLAEKAIFDIAKSKTNKGMAPVSEVLVDTFAMIEKRAEQKSEVTGCPTGIYGLDRKLSGLQPSDLVIVAGRPSMGKTAFALGMGLYAAAYEDKVLAVFSLEMSKESLVTRMLCSDGRVDSARLRGGFLNEDDWPRLARSAGRLSKSKMFIDDSGALSVLECRAKCRRIAAEHGLDVIIIDYLQLMRGSPNAQSREQEISEISRGLKTLAKELSVPVVALSQLNRGVEQRQDKRPGLADLRESGAIEQDADVIMFVYRDEVYNDETEDRGVAELIVGKQRNGPIGTVRCRFVHEFTRFENLAED